MTYFKYASEAFMSWGVSYIGTPDAVIKALEGEKKKLSGHSLTEYEEVLPGLIAMIKANMSSEVKRTIKVNANGSAAWKDDVRTSSQCYVLIEPVWNTYVE